ncbi:hypothetical protein Hanom_Chr12g01126221 [Helianthus anomalus]
MLKESVPIYHPNSLLGVLPRACLALSLRKVLNKHMFKSLLRLVEPPEETAFANCLLYNLLVHLCLSPPSIRSVARNRETVLTSLILLYLDTKGKVTIL